MLKEEIINNVDYKILIEKEKRSRLDNDIPTSANTCVDIIRLVWNKYGVENVGPIFLSLSKKRNQSKRSHTDMLKVIFEEIYLSINSEDEKISLLKAIIEITEGKIYVEFEFSNAVKKLTEILLAKSQIDEAAKLIQDIQIETFGSLDKKYKVEYILFQIQVLLAKRDFVRTLIVSNKVVRKNLNEEGLEYQKLEYFLLMTKFYNHEEKYYELSLCFKELYDFSVDIEKKLNALISEGKSDSERATKYKSILSSISSYEYFEKYVLFLNICPPKPEIINQLKALREKYVKELDSSILLGNLIKIKLGEDITKVNKALLDNYARLATFQDNDEYFNNGKLNLKLFRKYFIQHNILIMSKFFSQIYLQRISELLEIPKDEAELEICDMVTNDNLYSRINRIKQIATFRKKQNFDDKLNNLDFDLSKMLDTLESTCHLIHKENLKYDIK